MQRGAAMGDVEGIWSRARFLLLRLGLPPLLAAGMLTAAAGSADALGPGQPGVPQQAQPGTPIPGQSGILQQAQLAILRLSHQPFAMAFTPDGHYAYVANGGADSGIATVVDATVFPPQIVANVGVGNQPTAVALTPDGHYAYLTSGVLNTVSVIDTTSSPPHVATTVEISGNPVAVAMAPNSHYAYVVSATSSVVNVIDTAASPPRVVAIVSVQDSPDAVAFTPDGRYAFVANAGTNTVSVISAAAFPPVVAATVALPGGPGAGPDALAITPDGRLAYVTNFAGSPAVSVIDTTAIPPRVAYTIDLPAEAPVFGVAISPDGHFAYLAGGRAYSVSVVPVRRAADVVSAVARALTPLRVATTSLPRAAVGSAYHASVSASGGLPRYRWSITGGSLPAGLRLDRATGTISGIATQPGRAAFTVRAMDSAHPPASTAKNLSVLVEGAPASAANSERLVIELPAGTTLRLGTAPASRAAAVNPGTGAVNAYGAAGTIAGEAPVNVVPTLPPIPLGQAPKQPGAGSAGVPGGRPAGPAQPKPAAAQGGSGAIAALPAVLGLAFGLTIGLGAALIALLRPTWLPGRLSRRLDRLGPDA